MKTWRMDLPNEIEMGLRRHTHSLLQGLSLGIGSRGPSLQDSQVCLLQMGPHKDTASSQDMRRALMHPVTHFCS